MSTLHATTTLVKCPHCGNQFTPEEAIGHDIRLKLEKEFERKLLQNARVVEEKIRKQEEERFHLQLKMMHDDAVAKTERLKMLETQSIRMQQRESEIKEREERMEIEMKKRLLDREKIIREQADKAARDKALLEVREREQKLAREHERLELMLKKRVQEETEKAREEERMRHAETQKKLDDQVRLVNEMKRKSEQGSMQMQGEVQELALEEYLRSTFPRDEVEEIAKGKRGGDCVHVVKDHYDHVCGKILYESKRTKHFSTEWISKVKDDMRLKQADLGVIVTEALPEGMTRFGEIEGVWVCTFIEFKALALLFRFNLARIGEVLASQENKGDKMQLIYRYVTGVEFKQKLEAAFESFNEMQEDLMKEKTLFVSHWAKREKRLFKAMENLVSLYGDVRGIAGGAVQEIRCLEMNLQ
ncbi:MAG TPA: DUF2130 domain-containing protein [Ohtaekwangia sp.]|nr:DUF2130 domain-containing protein [Ohtaekwangia sp.]